jgi:hypothetical protein
VTGTLHLVPTGLSIAEGLRTGRGRPADGAAARRAPDNLAHLVEAFQEHADRDRAVSDLIRHHAEAGAVAAPAAVRQLQLTRWDRNLSAELHSLAESHVRLETGAGASAVVLVATDTDDGLLCATLNALALPGARALRYAPAPDRIQECTPATVTIVKIPGMDLAHADDFTTAMRHLGLLGRRLHELHPTTPVKFHLSGGYKAAMPFFISIAEGLRTLRDDPGTITACCLHEQTQGVNRLIAVPLRYFPGRMQQLARSDIDAVADGRRPVHHVAEGWAYEETGDGRYRLTPFGEGLRVLLHPTGPTLSDVVDQ